jgi:uncharacterized protein YjbI with pentapeptide repeats
MSDKAFLSEATDLIERITKAETSNFLEIAEIAGLNLTEDLAGANLSGFDLKNAELRDADLTDANLSHADLSGANLRGANLSGANLSSVNLNGAVVEEARFGANSGLTEEMKRDLKRRGAMFEDSPGIAANI